jgi:hypothetical protein
MNNRFGRRGTYNCELCDKLTRETGHAGDGRYCEDCNDRLEHENLHSDNDYPNDDCGDDECPVKHYTKAQRWWL